MHRSGSVEMETVDERRSDSTERRSPGGRWVPVAIAVLGVASVAAEIWGVVRGLALILTR